MVVSGHYFHKDIIREYDIRGIVGVNLGANDALALGRTMGAMVAHSRNIAIVGRDGRHSSPALEEELCRGLAASGVYVMRIGLCTSPMLAFSTKVLKAPLGIMVTGSHNAPDYNGFKIILNDKPFYGKQLRQMAQSAIHAHYSNSDNGGIVESNSLDAYVEYLSREICGSDRLKIAWDPGNGAAGHILSKLLHKVPASHYLINEEVDGSFPNHHPDPTKPENLEQLRNIVRDKKCHIGFAFDGDGDRIGIIDDKGDILWGDEILAILATEIIEANTDAVIIGDVKTSQRLFEYVKKIGGQAIISPTGHSIIKSQMMDNNALLAGEMSGHIFFADRYFGIDDGVYAALRMIRILTMSDKPLSELRQILPPSYATPEIRIAVSEAQKFNIMQKITVDIQQSDIDDARFSFIDGVRYVDEKGWWILRASNTEPAIIARCEAYQQSDLNPQITLLKDILIRNGVDKADLSALLEHHG